MGKLKVVSFVKFISVLFFFLIGVLCITFTTLYFDTFDKGFLKEYSNLVNCCCFIIVSIFTILTSVFFYNNKEFIYKFFLLIISCVTLCIIVLYLLKVTGFFEKIDSVEAFRQYVASFGVWTSIVFVVFQFLQVVVLPIPSFITVGAGVLLFGPFIGSVLSCIGIIAGSLTAFFLGKKFGYNLVKWLVGKTNLDKTLLAIKGKDKVIFTFMFLFPFFPDDVLCFVAGITTISPLFFVVMIVVVRVICVFTSSYSMNNSLIPYNTWWGIMLWILFFVLIFLLTFLIYKKGDKIEKVISKKILRKQRRK